MFKNIGNTHKYIHRGEVRDMVLRDVKEAHTAELLHKLLDEKYSSIEFTFVHVNGNVGYRVKCVSKYDNEFLTWDELHNYLHGMIRITCDKYLIKNYL